MAARLEVSESWLLRWLLMAKLPPLIVEAYADPTAIKERHARELRPLYATKEGTRAMMAAAATLTKIQGNLRQLRQPIMEGATTFAKLKAAVKPARKTKPARTAQKYRDDAGKLIAKAKPGRSGGLTLEIAGATDAAAAHKAAETAIAAHFGEGQGDRHGRFCHKSLFSMVKIAFCGGYWNRRPAGFAGR